MFKLNKFADNFQNDSSHDMYLEEDQEAVDDSYYGVDLDLSNEGEIFALRRKSWF